MILADAGVPMLMLEWPVLLIVLVPVIVVEAFLYSRWLRIPMRSAFVGSAKANGLSTLVGVPLAWIVMLALEIMVMVPTAMLTHGEGPKSPLWELVGFLVGIAWLGPPERKLFWMVPLAAALLLVPTFIVSVLIERRVCRASWPDAEEGPLRRAVWRANLVSYGMLFVVAIAWLACSIVNPHLSGFG
jgi:hypothetical protein